MNVVYAECGGDKSDDVTMTYIIVRRWLLLLLSCGPMAHNNTITPASVSDDGIMEWKTELKRVYVLQQENTAIDEQ